MQANLMLIWSKIMKRKVDTEPKKVRWADETPLERVKKALAKDKDNMSEAAKILRSIPREEAYDIIHRDDGYVVTRTIKLVYYNMKHDKYNQKQFANLYAVFVDIDEEYTENTAFKVKKDIIRADLENCPVLLYRMDGGIREAHSLRITSKVTNDTTVEIHESEHDTDTKDGVAAELSHSSPSNGAAQSDHGDKLNTDTSDTIVTLKFWNDKVASYVIKSDSNNSSLNYVFDLFFGWLNDLPNSIRESIEQTDIFQFLLDRYKEMQSELMVRDVKVVIKSSDDITDHTEQQNYNDSCVVNQEEAADVKLENDNLYLDKANALNQSSIEALPIFMLSASTVFDQFEGDCHVPILGEGSYV